MDATATFLAAVQTDGWTCGVLQPPMSTRFIAIGGDWPEVPGDPHNNDRHVFGVHQTVKVNPFAEASSIKLGSNFILPDAGQVASLNVGPLQIAPCFSAPVGSAGAAHLFGILIREYDVPLCPNQGAFGLIIDSPIDPLGRRHGAMLVSGDAIWHGGTSFIWERLENQTDWRWSLVQNPEDYGVSTKPGDMYFRSEGKSFTISVDSGGSPTFHVDRDGRVSALKLTIPCGSSSPSAGPDQDGRILFDTVANRLRVYANGKRFSIQMGQD